MYVCMYVLWRKLLLLIIKPLPGNVVLMRRRVVVGCIAIDGWWLIAGFRLITMVLASTMVESFIHSIQPRR